MKDLFVWTVLLTMEMLLPAETALEYDFTKCTFSDTGKEYQGTARHTTTGNLCQRWDSQSPHSHSVADADMNNLNLTLEENFCRNQGSETRPWCYTTNPDERWNYCDVPSCLMSCRLTAVGREYIGHLNVSESQTACLPWKDQSHLAQDFPENDLDAAENYCRNPNSSPGGPGCYIMKDSIKSWETCDISLCIVPRYCKETIRGREYMGTLSITSSGRTCQRWDSQTPHGHSISDSLMVDGTLSAAENYCRSTDSSVGSWCYTTDPDVRWEYCDIIFCDEYIDVERIFSNLEYQATLVPRYIFVSMVV